MRLVVPTAQCLNLLCGSASEERDLAVQIAWRYHHAPEVFPLLLWSRFYEENAAAWALPLFSLWRTRIEYQRNNRFNRGLPCQYPVPQLHRLACDIRIHAVSPPVGMG